MPNEIHSGKMLNFWNCFVGFFYSCISLIEIVLFGTRSYDQNVNNSLLSCSWLENWNEKMLLTTQQDHNVCAREWYTLYLEIVCIIPGYFQSYCVLFHHTMESQSKRRTRRRIIFVLNERVFCTVFNMYTLKSSSHLKLEDCSRSNEEQCDQFPNWRAMWPEWSNVVSSNAISASKTRAWVC